MNIFNFLFKSKKQSDLETKWINYLKETDDDLNWESPIGSPQVYKHNMHLTSMDTKMKDFTKILETPHAYRENHANVINDFIRNNPWHFISGIVFTNGLTGEQTVINSSYETNTTVQFPPGKLNDIANKKTIDDAPITC